MTRSRIYNVAMTAVGGLTMAGILTNRWFGLVGAILAVPLIWLLLRDPDWEATPYQRASAKFSFWAGLAVIGWLTMMIIVWGTPN